MTQAPPLHHLLDTPSLWLLPHGPLPLLAPPPPPPPTILPLCPVPSMPFNWLFHLDPTPASHTPYDHTLMATPTPNRHATHRSFTAEPTWPSAR